MRIIIIYILCLVFSVSKAQIPSIIAAVNSQRNVGNAIPTTGAFTITFDTTDNATITDFRTALSTYTTGGKAVTITKVPLELRTGQEYYINATPTTVQINYTNPLSLENAVYGYMSMLGINWYGAGENWFYKPSVINQPIITGWQAPAYRNRGFAGTGAIALPDNIAFDSTNTFRTNWYRWKKRTRWNQDFIDKGHTGEAFYNENKAISDANPQWFTNNLGKINGRIKIEIPEATAAYKAWAYTQYNPNELFNNIGTDPEDGRGGADDPLPPNGFQDINNWNHADKWWWLTNEVAKMFDENDTRTVVSALAYGDGPFNALAPKFPLRKNVLPLITPYAFQTSYLPREMVQVWSNKVEKQSLYDYWNITQYSLGLPQFSMTEMVEKLKFWNQNKVNGLFLETTDAGGPMGHMFWMASQLQWNPYLNFDSLYTKYLTDCFGAAAPEMRKMYNRWSNNYQEGAEADFTLINLKNASAMVAPSSIEWKRINELKGYAHFMKLITEHDNSLASMNKIFYWLYRIHDLMMVQTAAFMDQWYIAPYNMRPAAVYNPITPEQLNTQFLQDYDSIKVNYTVSDFVFDYNKVSYTVPIANDAWRFGILQNTSTFKAPFTGAVSITVGAQGNTIFKVYSDDGILIQDRVGIDSFAFTESFPDQPLWYEKNYTFNIVQGRFYNINNRGGFHRVKINTPGLVLFSRAGQEDFDNFGYPKKYFYVPTGTTEIVFSNPQPEFVTGTTISPSGVALFRTSAGAKNTYKITVPAGDDGKVWYLAFGSPYWQLRNLPNYFALQPFQYTENP